MLLRCQSGLEGLESYSEARPTLVTQDSVTTNRNTNPSPVKVSLNKPMLGIWLLAILVIAVTFFGVFDGDVQRLSKHFVSHSQENAVLLWIGYLLVLSFRGLTLVPSTPLLLFGLAVFPAHLLYATNLLGILVSSSLVIYSVNRTGVRHLVARMSNAKIRKLEVSMRKHGFTAVILWSFCPFVLTDLIVYVASAIGLPKKTILIGIMAGEAVLMAFYVYGGTALLEYVLT